MVSARGGMRGACRASSSAMKIRRFVLGAAPLLGVLLALLWWRWGRLAGLDDETLAARILESRGVLCTPKIVQRVGEGVLYVVCADGKYELVPQMSCSESYACEVLGVDAGCWDVAPYVR